jgi:O-antigen/teichoic acid export membrane protein
MLKKAFYKLYNKVGIKSDRTKNISKHVLLSFLYKGGGILANFLLVPITIDYLDTENYGIWLTLSSFISWFSFFDIGLGNGLRNKFAEAKAKKDMTAARGYVSTAYFTLGAVSLALIIVFCAFNYFIDWTKVFNTSPHLQKELGLLIPIVFAFFCLQLVAKLITTIYMADQHHSVQEKINFFIQTGTLLLIWIMTLTSQGSLFLFSIVFSIFPLFFLLLFNFFSFRKRYFYLTPSIKNWSKEYLKEIFGIGIHFFIIQIAVIVLFSSDNIIIVQLFGPEEVVAYNIAFKYFSIVSMSYTIVITPYWSSFTEAYFRRDFDWIKKSVHNIQKLWLAIPVILFFMVFISDWFYNFWIGKPLVIPTQLSIVMAVFVALITFNMIYVNFINGIGKIRLQLITSIISMLINIPLSIFFAKYLELGSTGVMLATCISLCYSIVLRPIQYRKIINNSAKGIWNR